MDGSSVGATASSAAQTPKMRWRSLEHKGVAFPPAYQPRGIVISIQGEKVPLTSDQEELVYAWAKKKETHYVQDPVFQSNFISDFTKLLPEKFKGITIADIDFSSAYRLADEEKVMKERDKENFKNLPREEKKKISLAKKAERERLKAMYGKAIVDGAEVDIANWLVEPPGLFMGRGQHPMRGRWKPRIKPQDVTLNLGEDAPVPEGNWAAIVYDHSSTWLATWMESLTGKRKYVWLHDSAALRQDSDMAKYDKARKLSEQQAKIEREVIKRMRASSRSSDDSRVATAAYLIVKLAMRVGDEKDPDEADTVGASTLRVEHIKFLQENGKQMIEFNFLGKDSVPWQKKLEVRSADDTKALYDNLQTFVQGKNPSSQIFDGINSRKVNAFFSSVMPGLTAKVFRTCIATRVVQNELKSRTKDNNPEEVGLSGQPSNQPKEHKVNRSSSEADKIYVARMANLKAAIECNHKKGVDPKNPAAKKAAEKFEESIAKKKEAIASLKAEIDARKWKTELQEKRLKERLERLEMQLRLQQETKDYNIGTSLRNYIDPRVMKAWLNYVDLDWTKIYTTTLQRKFKWVETYREKNFKTFYPELKEKI